MKRLKTLKAKTSESILFYFMISPFIIMFFVLKIIPFAQGLYLSFTNYSGFNYNNLKTVGFRNYIKVFTDNDAMYSLFKTFQIGVVVVPLGLILGLMFAMLLNRGVRAVGLFRTIYYIPSIIPVVAAGMMWRSIYNQQSGLFNMLLKPFGIPQMNWLGYDLIPLALIFMMLWGSGGGILIYIGALKNVPNELYESANIEGATGYKKFLKITLPLISPVIFFNLVTGVIGVLQLYTQPVILATAANAGVNGVMTSPPRPIYTYLVHIYQQIFANQRFGYGLALIWIIFIIIVAVSVIIFKTSNSWVYYEVSQDGGKNK